MRNTNDTSSSSYLWLLGYPSQVCGDLGRFLSGTDWENVSRESEWQWHWQMINGWSSTSASQWSCKCMARRGKRSGSWSAFVANIGNRKLNQRMSIGSGRREEFPNGHFRHQEMKWATRQEIALGAWSSREFHRASQEARRLLYKMPQKTWTRHQPMDRLPLTFDNSILEVNAFPDVHRRGYREWTLLINFFICQMTNHRKSTHPHSPWTNWIDSAGWRMLKMDQRRDEKRWANLRCQFSNESILTWTDVMPVMQRVKLIVVTNVSKLIITFTSEYHEEVALILDTLPVLHLSAVPWSTIFSLLVDENEDLSAVVRWSICAESIVPERGIAKDVWQGLTGKWEVRASSEEKFNVGEQTNIDHDEDTFTCSSWWSTLLNTNIFITEPSFDRCDSHSVTETKEQSGVLHIDRHDLQQRPKNKNSSAVVENHWSNWTREEVQKYLRRTEESGRRIFFHWSDHRRVAQFSLIRELSAHRVATVRWEMSSSTIFSVNRIQSSIGSTLFSMDRTRNSVSANRSNDDKKTLLSWSMHCSIVESFSHHRWIRVKNISVNPTIWTKNFRQIVKDFENDSTRGVDRRLGLALIRLGWSAMAQWSQCDSLFTPSCSLPCLVRDSVEHLPCQSNEWRYAARSWKDERDGPDAHLCRCRSREKKWIGLPWMSEAVHSLIWR